MGDNFWGIVFGGLVTIVAAGLTLWGVIYAARRAAKTAVETARLQSQADERHENSEKERNAIEGFDKLSTQLQEQADAQERRLTAQDKRMLAQDRKIAEQTRTIQQQAVTIGHQSQRIDDVEERAAKAQDEAALTKHGLDVAIRFVAHLIAMWPKPGEVRPIPPIPPELEDMIKTAKPHGGRVNDHPKKESPRERE